MHLDVTRLRGFYYRTQLGRIAQRALREQLVQLWPDVKGQTVAGFGFAAPMLRPFLGSARRVINLMPGQQGVIAWPEGEVNRSVLVEETQWPIATGSVDRLVVLHGLETCEFQTALLDEIWRVLGPGGRAVFIVPNRSGMWARGDATPFGFGRPYTLTQLEAQLGKARFQSERHISALYSHPSERPMWLRLAKLMEGVGIRGAIPLAAGVLMLEVSKQVHGKTPTGLGASVRSPLEVLEGIGKTVGEPVSGRLRG